MIVILIIVLMLLILILAYKYLYDDDLQPCSYCYLNPQSLPMMIHHMNELKYNSHAVGNRNKLLNPNLNFYKNRIKSEPKGDYIENILCEWSKDYDYLENKEGYVEWLFPTPENTAPHIYSLPLTPHEIQRMRDNGDIQKRYLRSFRMMLDFFGFQLSESLQFSLSPEVHKRFYHLQKQPHNYNHFTRILISLKYLGHSELQKKWLHFITKLINVGLLVDANNYYFNIWLTTIDR